MPEVAIHIDADATGAYKFRVSFGRRQFTTNMSPDLAASFYEVGNPEERERDSGMIPNAVPG